MLEKVRRRFSEAREVRRGVRSVVMAIVEGCAFKSERVDLLGRTTVDTAKVRNRREG